MNSIPAYYYVSKTKGQEVTFRTKESNAEIVKFKVNHAAQELTIKFKLRCIPAIKHLEKRGFRIAYEYNVFPKYVIKCLIPIQNVVAKTFETSSLVKESPEQNRQKSVYTLINNTEETKTYSTQDLNADISEFEINFPLRQLVVTFNIRGFSTVLRLEGIGKFENPQYKFGGSESLQKMLELLLDEGEFIKEERDIIQKLHDSALDYLTNNPYR